MNKETLYSLADTTVIEPLVNQWPAWAQLLSPIPASLHLANYQIKALQSYLEDPTAHIKASRDPEMIGGPFVDIPMYRADEVRKLLADMTKKRGKNIRLAKSLTEFHNWLVDEANGQSLESYYHDIPELLSGYVELVYDYYNRPTVRFFESLLYESEFYDRSLQSLRIWQLERDGSRAFFMSTPHLLSDGEFDLAIPFDHPRVDQLYGLDTQPRPFNEIREIFGCSQSESETLLPLLSDRPVCLPTPWNGDTVRISYLGHACLLIEWRGTTILTDPFIGVKPCVGGMKRISYGDLPEQIDYVLITHNHQDHFALETLLRLRHRVKHLVVPRSCGILYGDMSLKLMMQKLGYEHVIELDTLESIDIPDGKIFGVPFLGEHGDLAYGKCGYVVRCGREQMLFGADSDCLDERIYENVCKSLGAIETVFLGTESVGAPLFWCIGSLFLRRPQHNHEQSRRFHGCNAKSALDILDTVGAKRIYNYAMGLEPWVEHLLGLGLTETSPQYIESNKLLDMARHRGFLEAERLFGTQYIYLGGASSEPYVTSNINVNASVLAADVNDAEDEFAF